jgi:hypothetical protein
VKILQRFSNRAARLFIGRGVSRRQIKNYGEGLTSTFLVKGSKIKAQSFFLLKKNPVATSLK